MEKFEAPEIEVIELDEELMTETIGGQSNNPVSCGCDGDASSCSGDTVIFG